MAMIPSSLTNNTRLDDELGGFREMLQQLKIRRHDILNEVKNKERQGRMKRKREVNSWLEQVNIFLQQKSIQKSIETEVAQEREKFRLSDTLSLFRRGSSEKHVGIMKLGERLLKQSEFPRGLLLDDVKHQGLELLAKKMEGFTSSRTQAEVWSCFERGESRVGVFGIGGVGKTPLAMNINNQILNQQRLFDHVYYVTVSRETSVHKLQKDIAKAVGHRLEYEDEPKRAAELRKALAMREGSLLILDDVWEDITMEEVGVVVEEVRCKLLITTRKRDVCFRMNCFPVKMWPLLYQESWDLFEKQLGNFEAPSLEVKKTARLVAQECDGLPLGIITMARSMRGVTSVHEWRDALKRLQNPCSGHHDMKEKVFSILRYSYDRLYDDKHRKCFLYCALYPEDYEIGRNRLIRQLIRAGLLDGTKRKESIDEGHTLLDHLENASMLECVTDCLYSRRYVKMHDLVRDMAIEIIGSTGMLKGGLSLKEIPAKEEWDNKDLEWVSLMENKIDRIEGMMPDCTNISVLLLQHNLTLRSVSDSFFVKMIGLKVLDLSYTCVKELPGSISRLFNLIALLLSCCRSLEYIPSLTKLTKLRDLDISECLMMRALPEGMEKLASLEHLNLQYSGIEGVYEGIFINLLNLESFLCSDGIYFPPEELISLKHLKLFYGFHFIFEGVGWFKSLKTYYVTVERKGFLQVEIEDEEANTDRKIVVKGAEVCFLVPQNVRTLKLTKCNFGVGSLLEAFPSLADVTDLQLCQLYDFEQGVENIIPEGWTKNTLHGIRHLEIEYVDEFRGLIGEEAGKKNPFISFSGLRKLEITNCQKLKKLWMLNLELPILEEIDISYCPQMEEIFATEKGRTIRLPRLHSLLVLGMHNLRSICGNCKVFFPNLISLEVLSSPSMKNTGMKIHCMPSLEFIEIKDCTKMLEIFAAEDGAEDDKIHLPKLETLVLSNVPELRSICRKTIVCNSLQLASIDCDFGVKIENCPISLPTRLSVITNNDPLPVFRASAIRRGWWDSLHWNDPATHSLLNQTGCFHYCFDHCHPLCCSCT